MEDMPLLNYEDVDHAIEWCENQLLAKHSSFTAEEAPLAAQTFCAGFTPAELRGLQALLEPRTYEEGDYICREGEPTEAMFFILSGEISVVVPLGQGRAGRITTLSAGSAFGEMAMLDHGVRSADVVADTPISCLMLAYERLERDATELGERIRLKLINNIAGVLSQKLRQAALEIKSLKR
jgi:glutaminase